MAAQSLSLIPVRVNDIVKIDGSLVGKLQVSFSVPGHSMNTMYRQMMLWNRSIATLIPCKYSPNPDNDVYVTQAVIDDTFGNNLLVSNKAVSAMRGFGRLGGHWVADQLEELKTENLEVRNFERISPKDPNMILSKFCIGLRKGYEEECEPTALLVILCTIFPARTYNINDGY